MKPKKLVRFIKRKKYVKENFIKATKFMRDGNYFFDDTLTYIFNEEEIKLVKTIFPVTLFRKKMQHIITIIIRHIFFFRRIKVQGNLSNFKGSLYLPANNNNVDKEAKVFDFVNNEVLSIYADEKKFRKEKEDYSYFDQFFPLPKQLSSDVHNLLIVEEYILFIPSNKWTDEQYSGVMNLIFKYYLNYYNCCEKNSSYSMVNTQTMIEKLDCEKEIYNFLKDNVSEDISNLELPFVKIHGDLWSANILIKDWGAKELYFIDWEHAQEFFFLYDIFWMMQNEFIYNNRDQYILDYFSGKYDMNFIALFRNFGLEFKKKYRKDYFFVFLINVYKTRFESKDDVAKSAFYWQMYKLLEHISISS